MAKELQPSISYHARKWRTTDMVTNILSSSFIAYSAAALLCPQSVLSPFISSSGHYPGSHAAKVQRAKVCLMAHNQVWLGLPTGRFQSGGTCQIAAARARW